MKFNRLVLILSLYSTPVVTLHAATLQGCAAKRQQIETQLQYAKSANNSARVQGLQRALDNNIRYCNDHYLADKRQQKVEKKAQKVAKLQHELQQQKRAGHHDKIVEKENKLAKAQAELDRAKQQLRQ